MLLPETETQHCCCPQRVPTYLPPSAAPLPAGTLRLPPFACPPRPSNRPFSAHRLSARRLPPLRCYSPRTATPPPPRNHSARPRTISESAVPLDGRFCPTPPRAQRKCCEPLPLPDRAPGRHSPARLIRSPRSQRLQHGRIDAARALAGVDIVVVVLHPRLAPEHNVLPRRLALGAPVEALLGDRAVPVHVGKGQGAGD
jgi:hypothetical protein